MNLRGVRYLRDFWQWLHLQWRLGLWRLCIRFRDSVTLTTRQGVFTLPTDVNDSISESLFTRREYEHDLVTRAMHVVLDITGRARGTGTLIDIGANNGVISIGMILNGEVERGIAIEPDPRNFARLEHNVAQNHLDDRILCLNYAASDAEGSLAFELSSDNYGDHRVRRSLATPDGAELFGESKRPILKVEADTLDSLIAGADRNFSADVSVIWIDVQGYEGYVFMGAKQVLTSGAPVVSEIWPYGIQRAGMSREAFCGIVGEIWSAYWMQRRGKFVKYPIEVFPTVFDELGFDGAFDNVIFSRT